MLTNIDIDQLFEFAEQPYPAGFGLIVMNCKVLANTIIKAPSLSDQHQWSLLEKLADFAKHVHETMQTNDPAP